jgi:hypothetical protein
MRLIPLLLLAGCAPLWGTWMFTLDYTVATGDECATTVTHNFSGAAAPEEAIGDTGWTSEATQDVSPQVFFARLEEYQDGAVLIVGEEALPGKESGGGAWAFEWTGSSAGEESQTDASGYSYGHRYDDTSSLRVGGIFANGTFAGTYDSGSETWDTWDESDTWSGEAAAVVGENGAIPAGSYLLLEDGTAAGNAREAYDCESAGCALTVEAVCAYAYAMTGVYTEFTPDDSRWTEDAGQPAGL